MKRASAVTLSALILAVSGAVSSAVPPAHPAAAASAPAYLYKTTFVRAAPGKPLELIDLLKARMAFHDAAGDELALFSGAAGEGFGVAVGVVCAAGAGSVSGIRSERPRR